jgi:hypothetical protein
MPRGDHEAVEGLAGGEAKHGKLHDPVDDTPHLTSRHISGIWVLVIKSKQSVPRYERIDSHPHGCE